MTAPGPGPAGLRFTALGDSLTEGVGDPLPGGGWRGWAALLAESLGSPGRPVRLANLARSGARTGDTAEEQLTEARRHRPHLASVIVGGNDILRSAFDLHRSTRDLDLLIGTLAADGAVVLTACLPDPGRMLRLPAAVARPLSRRMRSVNEVVHQLSRRHDALHAHFADHPVAGDRAAWSVDRLHPSERGHRLLAREFHALLTARGLTAGPPPDDRTDQPPPTPAADLRWMATRGARWALDRSRDLLPGLVRLAAVETAHRVRGTTDRLDAAARASVRAALLATAAAPAAAPGPGPRAPSGAVPSAVPSAAPAGAGPGRARPARRTAPLPPPLRPPPLPGRTVPAVADLARCPP